MAQQEGQRVEQHYDTSGIQHELSGPSHENDVDTFAGFHWQFSGLVDPHSIFDPTSFTGTAYPLEMDATLLFGNFSHDAVLPSDYYSDSNLNDLMLAQPPGLEDPLADAYLTVPESGGDLCSSWYNPWPFSTVRDRPRIALSDN
jgi:hypothetical protein